MDMIGIDEARMLVADADLWPRIRDFLWDFAPQIHPSWVEDLEVGAANGVFQTLKLSDSQTFNKNVRHILSYAELSCTLGIIKFG